MHSEKTAFADKVWLIMPKDGGDLEDFNARVFYTVKTAHKNLSFSKLGKKGSYKNGAHWKMRLRRFLNRFLFLKINKVFVIGGCGLFRAYFCKHV